MNSYNQDGDRGRGVHARLTHPRQEPPDRGVRGLLRIQVSGPRDLRETSDEPPCRERGHHQRSELDRPGLRL